MNNRPTYDELDRALARRVGDHSAVGGEDWAAFSARRSGVSVRAPRRWLGRSVAAAVMVLGALVGGGGYLLGWYGEVQKQAFALTEIKLHASPKVEPLLDRTEGRPLLAQAQPVRPAAPDFSASLAAVVAPTLVPTPALDTDTEEAPPASANGPTATKPVRRASSGLHPTEPVRSARSLDRKLRIGAYAALGAASSGTGVRSDLRSAVAMDYTVGRYEGKLSFDPSQLKHDFPVSVGISLDIPLAKRLRLSTGLLYTYVRSSASTSSGFNYNYEQKLHYLGIPVSVAYDFFVSRPVDLYVTGGAAAEVAVAGTARSEVRSASGERLSEEHQSLDAQGLMVSFNLGVGVGVRLSPRVGLYAEPGVTGYLPNDTHPINFRTATPVQFSLRAGIRVKL